MSVIAKLPITIPAAAVAASATAKKQQRDDCQQNGSEHKINTFIEWATCSVPAHFSYARSVHIEIRILCTSFAAFLFAIK